MKYFIVIDMQNGFTTGSLKNSAAAAIIPKIADEIKKHKDRGFEIIATRDTHQKNYLQTQEGKFLPIEHCIEGTDDWQVVKEIAPLCDKFIDKPAFGFKDWEKALKNPEEIHLCGTCTSICVASNFSIIKASFPEAPVFVHKDLCACLTEQTNEAAIAVMKCQQAILV